MAVSRGTPASALRGTTDNRAGTDRRYKPWATISWDAVHPLATADHGGHEAFCSRAFADWNIPFLDGDSRRLAAFSSSSAPTLESLLAFVGQKAISGSF